MRKPFYYFIEPVSTELARILEELERAIYQSPRFMITHSRTLIEAIMDKVMLYENIPTEAFVPIIEKIRILDQEGLLNKEVNDALHKIRKLGNIAAHDVRAFRYSESLITWENIYVIVKWFVEVYGSLEIDVPGYVDPIMKSDSSYNLEEMHIRLERFEELLQRSIEVEEFRSKISKEQGTMVKETVPKVEISISNEEKTPFTSYDEKPGLTTVRTITFKDDEIDIPFFLRDTFLLPQRFPNSARYLIRLNGEQEARLMSELPSNLDQLHTKVTRYNEKHTEVFFNELKQFIQEEIRRKKLLESRPGELFLFYKEEEIVVTEDFGKFVITNEQFPGSPNMIRQLHEDGIKKIRDLPKEFVIIGKYKSVGKTTVTNFFNQLKSLQRKTIASEE